MPEEKLNVESEELASTSRAYGTLFLPEIMEVSALKSGLSQRHKESEDGELCMWV